MRDRYIYIAFARIASCSLLCDYIEVSTHLTLRLDQMDDRDIYICTCAYSALTHSVGSSQRVYRIEDG